MALKTISLSGLDRLIERYTDKGGLVHQMREGVLLNGDLLLYSPDPELNLKTFVVKEVFVNGWMSDQTIRAYNKCPKKYQKIIDKL